MTNANMDGLHSWLLANMDTIIMSMAEKWRENSGI